MTIIVPIAWDRYKTTSALDVQQLAASTVVDSIDGLEKLKFTYGGEPVPRLSKLDLLLTNSGRTPIRDQDVVTPIRLAVEKGGQILDIRVQEVSPPDLGVTTATASDRESVTVRFPLLNPGDGARVSLLLAGGPSDLSVTGRIAGVPVLRVVDKRSDTANGWRHLRWTFWLVACFTVFGFIGVVSALTQLGGERQIARLWRTGTLAMGGSTAREYLDALGRFSPIKDEELEEVVAYLRSLQLDQSVTEDQRVMLNGMIGQALTNLSNVYGGLGIVAVLTAVGAVYVVVSLL